MGLMDYTTKGAITPNKCMSTIPCQGGRNGILQGCTVLGLVMFDIFRHNLEEGLENMKCR